MFYQFLARCSKEERREFMLEGQGVRDFALLSERGTFDRREGVKDGEMHEEMLEAMVSCFYARMKEPFCMPIQHPTQSLLQLLIIRGLLASPTK